MGVLQGVYGVEKKRVVEKVFTTIEGVAEWLDWAKDHNVRILEPWDNAWISPRSAGEDPDYWAVYRQPSDEMMVVIAAIYEDDIAKDSFGTFDDAQFALACFCHWKGETYKEQVDGKTVYRVRTRK